MKNVLKVLGGLVVVILVSLGVYHVSAPNTVEPTALGGGDVRNVGEVATNGQGFGNLPVTVNWDGGKIGPKFNTAFWKNTTGQTVYVNYLSVATDATASSTFAVYAYATTSAPRTLYDFTAPANNTSTLLAINNFSFATSSTATTTSNLEKAFAGRVIRVPVNSYVNIVLQAPAATCLSSGGSCESATSTNRGFNLQWRIGYHN